MSPDKKVALITGGNKGIGLETARQLGKLGITVLIGVRDEAKGEAAVAELKKDGVEARAVKLDVDNPSDYAAVAKLIEKGNGWRLTLAEDLLSILRESVELSRERRLYLINHYFNPPH